MGGVWWVEGEGYGGGGNALDWQAVRDRACCSGGLKGSGVSPLGDSSVKALSLCAKATPRWEASCPPPHQPFLSNSVHCLAVCPATDPHPTWGLWRFAHS